MTPTLVADNAFVIPYREDLARIVDHARRVVYEGKHFLAMRAGVDEARLLRNTGHNCPSPIHLNYDWNGSSPWDVQKVTAGELVINQGMFVLSDLGTGKTRSVLYAFDWLRKGGKGKRLLVCATMSTMTIVWEREIFEHFPHLSRAVLYGTRKQRLRALAQGTDVCIINHDGVKVIRDELTKAGFDVVCVDELAIMRNAQTDRWKAINGVARAANYVWGLTAAPIPHAPTDAWAQIKLVDPAKTTKYFGPFRDTVMTRLTQFKWVPKANASTTVFDAMQPSVRFTRDDISQLPEFIEADRDVELSVQQKGVYGELVKKMRSLYGDKEMLAANEGVLLGKLLQVASGYVYSTDKGVIELPCEERYQALFDLLSETSQKVIVFAPFVHAVQGIHKRLRKEKFDAELIHGDTSRAERDRIFRTFQSTPAINPIVAHPGTMAHGLTLTAANVIVWWSPSTSLEIYDQANGRINRHGQKHKMLAARLIGSPIERRVYKRLSQHAAMQGVLLEMFEQDSVKNI